MRTIVEPELESVEFYQGQVALVQRLVKAVTSEHMREELLTVTRQYEALILRAQAARLAGI
jgi:hypothetical protein